MNAHVTISDIRHDVSKIREEIGGQLHSVSRVPTRRKHDTYHPLDSTQVSYLRCNKDRGLTFV